MPSVDSQVDALEHSVDMAAVVDSLTSISMLQAAVKNACRPQANSPGLVLCRIQPFDVGAVVVTCCCQRKAAASMLILRHVA